MKPSIVVLLLVAQLATVRANAIIRSQFALNDRSGELMRVLSMVDVSDRNMNTWWDQFSVSWAEYDLKVKQDPILYCSSWEMLLKDLAELKTKVDLVVTGLEAKEEQLRQIREILEHTEMGGKSGLHCKEDPNQPICVALDGLDKQAADERTRLMAQLKKVSDEKTKVETYPCDCTYNDWADNWGTCSVSCDVGIKEETRKIRWEKRNSGKDCNPGDAKRTGKCNDGCCPVNCEWEEWGTWSACPEILTSDPQYEHAYRSIKVEHECSQRGGQKCVGKTQKSRQCNILDIKNEKISDLEDEIKSLEDEIKGLKEGCTKQEGKTGGTGTSWQGGCPEKLLASETSSKSDIRFFYDGVYTGVPGSDGSQRPHWVRVDGDKTMVIWYDTGRWLIGIGKMESDKLELTAEMRSEVTSAACPTGRPIMGSLFPLSWEVTHYDSFAHEDYWRPIGAQVVANSG